VATRILRALRETLGAPKISAQTAARRTHTLPLARAGRTAGGISAVGQASHERLTALTARCTYLWKPCGWKEKQEANRAHARASGWKDGSGRSSRTGSIRVAHSFAPRGNLQSLTRVCAEPRRFVKRRAARARHLSPTHHPRRAADTMLRGPPQRLAFAFCASGRMNGRHRVKFRTRGRSTSRARCAARVATDRYRRTCGSGSTQITFADWRTKTRTRLRYRGAGVARRLNTTPSPLLNLITPDMATHTFSPCAAHTIA